MRIAHASSSAFLCRTTGRINHGKELVRKVSCRQRVDFGRQATLAEQQLERSIGELVGERDDLSILLDAITAEGHHDGDSLLLP